VEEMVVGVGCGGKKSKTAKERGNVRWLWWWFLLLDHDSVEEEELVCWWLSLVDVRGGGSDKE